jgi:hypothetical protein
MLLEKTPRSPQLPVTRHALLVFLGNFAQDAGAAIAAP